MARKKATAEPVADDKGYRATRYATLQREVEVKQAELADLEARRDRYADEG